MSRLLTIVEGCLIADPAARWTAQQVIDALHALNDDVSATSGRDVATAGPVVVTPPPIPVSGGMTYDVMAIVDVLKSLGVDDEVISTVADTIGHCAVSALSVLAGCGVLAGKSLAVRRVLTPREEYALVSLGTQVGWRSTS